MLNPENLPLRASLPLTNKINQSYHLTTIYLLSSSQPGSDLGIDIHIS